MNIGQWYTYDGTPESSTTSHEAGIDVMVVSQNQINNTSLVRIRPWGLKLSGSTYNLNNQTLTVKADNSTKSSETSYDFREASTNEKFYLTNDYPFKRASGSGSLVDGAYVYDFTITHENDGTKTIPIYALIPFHNSASGRNWEVDIEIELPTIARANTVVISKTYIDDPINIAINKTDDSFTTTLIYNAINTDGTVTTEEIANKTTNKNISYTISTEKLTTILSKNKTSTSVLGILYAYTYSGNTQIGQKSYDLTLNIEETPPIVSATVVDTNSTTIALTGDSSKIVKYISKPKVTITAQAQQQADISSYSTVWGNSSSTAQETTFNSGIDSNIVTVSAKDSRNWVGEEEYDLNALGKYIEYIKPNFSKFTLSRPETTSNTINADLTGVWFNSSFGATSNTLELKYRYKEKGGEYGDYQTITLTTNENNFSLNGSLGSSFNYQKQIDFEFVLTDKLMSVITTFNVEKGESIIRVAETYVLIRGNLNIEGNLNISGNTNVDGNFTINGNPINSGSLISISGSVAEQTTYTISNWQWTNFNLTNLKKNIGDGFEISTDSIKCKKTMVISLSSLAVFLSTVNGEINARIVKNDEVIAYIIANSPNSSKIQSITIADAIIDVSENDIISFQFSGNAGDYIILDRPNMCYMTATEIK